jgi:hypothetical protein
MTPNLQETRRTSRLITYVLMFGMIGVVNCASEQPLHAQESSRVNITDNSGLTREQAEKELENLRALIAHGRDKVEKLHREPAASSDIVAQAEKELQTYQEKLVLYKQLVSLLAGQRDGQLTTEGNWDSGRDVDSPTLKVNGSQNSGSITLDGGDLSLSRAEHDAGTLNIVPKRRADAAQHQMQQMQLEAAKQALQAREAELAKATFELSRQEREWPPLEGGELKVYTLMSLPPEDAAKSIESLFGPRTMRVAIDDRSNSLIVYGKPDTLQAVEALLMRLDQSERDVSQPNSSTTMRPLMLRVIWLADGKLASSGTAPEAVLPPNVLKAINKLGLESPAVITQTVNSLAVTPNEGVEFETSVPALLMSQMFELGYSGKVTATGPDQATVAMRVAVVGKGVNSQLQGSITMPLQHYIVLGTSNAVIPMPRDVAGGDGAMVPGGISYGDFVGDPSSTPGLPPAPAQAPAAGFDSSRFAFVVQVVPAESFAPEHQPRERRQE